MTFMEEDGKPCGLPHSATVLNNSPLHACHLVTTVVRITPETPSVACYLFLFYTQSSIDFESNLNNPLLLNYLVASKKAHSVVELPGIIHHLSPPVGSSVNETYNQPM